MVYVTCNLLAQKGGNTKGHRSNVYPFPCNFSPFEYSEKVILFPVSSDLQEAVGDKVSDAR